MEIILYQFSKPPNSTKQPSGGGLSVSGELRDRCDIAAPSIRFGVVETATSLTVYNYAYIPSFGRYYFIQNWEYDLGVWIGSMDVDVLATYKGIIGASTQYALRSASQWDGRIIDRSYPTIAQSDGSVSTSWQALPWDLNTGCYVVGVKGKLTDFFIFTASQMASFFEYIFSDDYADQYVPGWAEKFPELKAALNPLQYISSITWYPLRLLGSGASLTVGWANYPGGGEKVPENGLLDIPSINFQIPQHPQAAARGEYLNLSPYSRYSLFFPPWGLIALDSTILCNCSTVIADLHLDCKTGACTLDVTTDTGILLSRLESQLGITCQYTQVVSNGFGIGNVLMAGMSAAGSIATGNYLGAASGVMTAIGDAVDAITPSANSIGTSGGVNSLTGRAGLQASFLHITDEDLPHRGRPLCKRIQISNLSGYVLVANAEIDSPMATSAENQRIIDYMEGGFVFE